LTLFQEATYTSNSSGTFRGWPDRRYMYI